MLQMAHRSLKGISSGASVLAMSIRPAGTSAAAMAGAEEVTEKESVYFMDGQEQTWLAGECGKV